MAPMSPSRPAALVAMGASAFADLFDAPRLAALRELSRIDDPVRVDDLTSSDVLARLRDVEVLITGWGGPRLGPMLLATAPHLRAVLHAGGSVKGQISQAIWDAGVLVTSAADANAIPVAEYTVATILLEAKRVPAYIDGYARTRDVAGAWRHDLPPALGFGGTVGIVGLSRVGRRVAELLRPFDFRVLAADPLQDARGAALVGAQLIGLDDLMAQSDIVTIHAPELPETRHLIDARRLALLRHDSVLINTARGSLVDAEALMARCREGTLRAILDVTEPEPLPADSPLFTTPGVVLTPHIAGAMHAETHRLADAVLEELRRINESQPPLHRVDRRSLSHIA
ncbi:hypothetical protein B1729_08835 [Microbacterium sp. B35-04]|uniref:hydroxyacid dehydrogenase n=1 Tax=unclassified Microbacterium TaxID=2609290 RepID=UPI0013D0DA93|nr:MULTISPECIES: hydroxyacid dehydrogenase [unclassified Microbacterium]KAF2413651.1 hypothetical protein B1729_08835 [Microbacterium sp. B35-04]KAF2418539.1 hypothetical protein B2K11_07885 [Microbacterium sp. B35-30]